MLWNVHHNKKCLLFAFVAQFSKNLIDNAEQYVNNHYYKIETNLGIIFFLTCTLNINDLTVVCIIILLVSSSDG